MSLTCIGITGDAGFMTPGEIPRKMAILLVRFFQWPFLRNIPISEADGLLN